MIVYNNNYCYISCYAAVSMRHDVFYMSTNLVSRIIRLAQACRYTAVVFEVGRVDVRGVVP
jgi:hypothetical protein